jgi:hypothetical protein
MECDDAINVEQALPNDEENKTVSETNDDSFILVEMSVFSHLLSIG